MKKQALIIIIAIISLMIFSCKTSNQSTTNLNNEETIADNQSSSTKDPQKVAVTPSKKENKPVVNQATTKDPQKVAVTPAKKEPKPVVNEPAIPSQPIKIEPVIIKDEISQKINMTLGLVKFSFSIFEELSTKEKGSSMAFSPVSLNLALGLVYTGAKNQTRDEFHKVIGFEKEENAFNESFVAYYKYLHNFKKDTVIDFNIANKIFVEKTYQVLDSYKKNIEENFDGSFQQMDFVNRALESEKNINKWVEDVTNNRIKDLLPYKTITNLTRMVLVNAIYIKSDWRYPFNKDKTTEKDFYSSKSDKEPKDFMIQKIEGMKYAQIDDFKVVEMEYNTPDLSLLVILPDKSSIDNIHNYIPDVDKYDNILNSLTKKEVIVEIPKFKAESSFNLNEILIKKGLVSAFQSADFSGISGKKDLEISQVIQKVFFEIDEVGSEAAAATAIVMRVTSMAPDIQKPEPMKFIANKPFIYILKENKFNTPLFIGQYTGK